MKPKIILLLGVQREHISIRNYDMYILKENRTDVLLYRTFIFFLRSSVTTIIIFQCTYIRNTVYNTNLVYYFANITLITILYHLYTRIANVYRIIAYSTYNIIIKLLPYYEIYCFICLQICSVYRGNC